MKKKIISFSLIISICMIFVFESPAFAAYNRGMAVSYANTYWSNYNKSFRAFSNDCTNFVSQCLNAGTKPMDSTWKYTNSLSYTNAWTVSADNYKYWTSGNRGSLAGIHVGTTGAPYPNGVSTGDVFYYAWYGSSGGAIGHAAFYTANGQDPNGDKYTGALVNQHTSDRKHAIWSLTSYNTLKNSTRIYCVKISNT